MRNNRSKTIEIENEDLQIQRITPISEVDALGVEIKNSSQLILEFGFNPDPDFNDDRHKVIIDTRKVINIEMAKALHKN